MGALQGRLMSVKIGISLIAWQNDDLPDLTAKFTTEGAMEDAGRIGYAGVERGRRTGITSLIII